MTNTLEEAVLNVLPTDDIGMSRAGILYYIRTNGSHVDATGDQVSEALKRLSKKGLAYTVKPNGYLWVRAEFPPETS
jgi:hypothetical protein